MPLPAEIRSLAAAPGGVLTRKDALRLGATGRQVTRWTADGELRLLGRGILTINARPDSVKQRHAELAHAIGATYGGRLAISHHSAIVMAGLPAYDMDLDTIRLVRRNGGDSRRSNGLRISRCAIELPTYPMYGAPVVTEAVAIVQVARECGIDAAVVAADEALHRGSLTLENLETAVRLLEQIRPSPRARQLVHLVDAKSESPGESRLRLIAERAGLALEPQYVVRDVHGEFLGRCDFRIRDTRVLVEFDGQQKYRDPAAMFQEKLRQEDIEQCGWIVVRFVWKHLAFPLEVVRRLNVAVDLADFRYGTATCVS